MKKLYATFPGRLFIFLGFLISTTLIPPDSSKGEVKPRNSQGKKESKETFVNLDIHSQFVLDILNKLLGFPIGPLGGKAEIKSKVTGFLSNLTIHASLKFPQASYKNLYTEELSIELELKNPQNLQDLSLTGSLKLPRASIYGIHLTNLTAHIRLNEGYLNISDLSATLFDGKLVGSAQIPLRPALVTLSLIPSRLNLQIISTALRLSIEGGAEFQNETPLIGPKSIKSLSKKPVSKILREPTLNLQIQASSPELQVVLKDIFSQETNCFLPSTFCSLLRDFQGELVSLRGRILGPLSRLGFQGDFLLREVKLSNSPIQQIVGRASYPNPGNQQVQLDFVEVMTPYQAFDRATFSLHRNWVDNCPDRKTNSCPNSISWSLQAQKGNNLLKGNGLIDLNTRTFEVNLDGKELNLLDLSRLKKGAFPYQGQMDIQVRGFGSLANPQVQGSVRFKNLQFKNLPVPDILATFALKEKQLKSTINAFKGEYTAALDLLLTPSLDYTFNMALQQASIEKILSFFYPLEDMKGTLSGRIFSEGSLKNLEEASAKVTLNQVNLQIYDQDFFNEGMVELNVTREKLSFISVKLRERTGELGLFLQGDLNFKGELNLGVDGLIELRLITPFVPHQFIRELNGRAQVLLDLRGTYGNPELNGVVEIRQGLVSFISYPDPITNITGKFLLKKNRIELTQFRGRLETPGVQGDTSLLEASGNLFLEGKSLSSVEVILRGQNITIRQPFEFLAIKANTRLALKGKPDALLLSGTAEVVNAQYLEVLDIQSLIRMTGRQRDLRNPAEFPIRTLGLDVVVKSVRTARLRGRSMDLNLQVDLTLRGTIQRPEIRGHIGTTSGKVSFENRDYTISLGSIDFIDPTSLNPDINLQARTEIRNYQIFLTLQGSLKDLSLSLNSDPPLPERDITALLAFGGTLDRVLGTFSTLGAEQVARLVIPPVQSQFGGRLERLTRLDRLEIEPFEAQNGAGLGASFTPRVIIGKEFFKDFFLTFSTTVGVAQEKQLVQLRYVISDRFSLIVERDNENQTNVSARIRFEFK
jgi:hypothetical protein